MTYLVRTATASWVGSMSLLWKRPNGRQHLLLLAWVYIAAISTSACEAGASLSRERKSVFQQKVSKSIQSKLYPRAFILAMHKN